MTKNPPTNTNLATPPLSLSEKAAHLVWQNVNHIGRSTYLRLRTAWQNAPHCFQNLATDFPLFSPNTDFDNPPDFTPSPLLSEKQLASLEESRSQYGPDPTSYVELLTKNKVNFLLRCENSPLWPSLLEEIPDCPEILYYRGDINLLNTPFPLAVVGTRHPTLYGQQATNKIIRELALSQPTIISGFMYGIDQIAHQAALNNHLSTVAVLGFGLCNSRYQTQFHHLYHQMLDSNQLFISEFPPWSITRAGNFPMRNRIVAGLSWGTLVIEAALKSGSFITAHLATDYGREVFATPGPITSAYSQGTKLLIKEGATLVSDGQDIITELNLSSPSNPQSTTTHPTPTLHLPNLPRKILELITFNSILNFDQIHDLLPLPISDLQSALSLLLIQELIANQNDNYYPTRS